MKTAGYSGTPLAKKLGIKNNFRIKVVNQPEHYLQLFSDLPGNIHFVKDEKIKKDLIHYFAKEAATLNKDIQKLKTEIEPNGMIWISWPKKASKMITDITENLVRTTGLKNGLVDIKICAVDEIWSGLKFVIPVKDR